MNGKIIFIVVISFAISAISCKNNSGKTDNDSTVNTPEKLIIPEVPITISSPQKKAEFLLSSFWSNYNFSDTTLVEKESFTEGLLFTFLAIVKKYKSPDIIHIYNLFLDKIMNVKPKVREKFLTLIEYNYYHPNSQIKDEELYKMMLNKAILTGSLPKSEADRYKFQIKMISQNEPGKRANNFSFTTPQGKLSSLYNTNGKFIILILFDPECEHCIETIERMEISPVLKSEKVKILAIMPENNKNKFLKGLNKIPKGWYSGYDSKEDIMNNILYDLRPSPSLYLLDENKTVLIKDGFLPEIEGYLARVI